MSAPKKQDSDFPQDRLSQYDDLDATPGLYDEDNPPPRPERKSTDFAGSKLTWLVNDFNHINTSVYEAVMVAAHRARQVGRLQKREIDAYNSAQVLTPESIEEEETSEKGIDHFNHIKPTIRALDELMEQKLEFHYLEDEKK